MVLVALPLCSLISMFYTDSFSVALGQKGAFWIYAFPIISICVAGLCDALARIEVGAAKNAKLVVRIVANMFGIILACAMRTEKGFYLRLLPVIPSLICGILLIREIYNTLYTAIMLSRWAAIKS